MKDQLYDFEEAKEIICLRCVMPLNDYDCFDCPVAKTYRELLNEEFGPDFPNHVFAHAKDSPTYKANPEKWLARRHRKGDVRAKARKVVVRKKDTGHLKDNRCTTRRKNKMEVED